MLSGTKQSVVFLKETSNLKLEIKDRQELREKLNEAGKKKIDEDIGKLKKGMEGETNVKNELRFSYTFPLYILSDVYYEFGDRTAQIDFLVFTETLCFVIECKYFEKKVKIDNEGEFTANNRCIYSPLMQNKKHMEIIRQLEYERIGRKARNFEKRYRSLVVFANDSSNLDRKEAKREVKRQVIRRDQLLEIINTESKKSRNHKLSEKEIREWAQWFLERSMDSKKDYLWQYQEYIKNTVDTKDDELKKELEEYRTKTYKKKGCQAYEIFINAQLDKMVEEKPANKRELINIFLSRKENVNDKYFEEECKKVSEYGNEILKIIEKYR